MGKCSVMETRGASRSIREEAAVGASAQGGRGCGRPRATCPRWEGRLCRPSAGWFQRSAGELEPEAEASRAREAADQTARFRIWQRRGGGWLLGGAAGQERVWAGRRLEEPGRKRWRNKKEGTSWACTRLDRESPSMSQQPRSAVSELGAGRAPQTSSWPRDQLPRASRLGQGS